MKRSEVDFNKLSPMMKEYIKTKNDYEDIILFYRLGDFYEMFFEDAVTASHELGLTLTGKSAGLKEKIPMCGIPHHAKDTYISKLIDGGYKVAICEQMENPSETKGIIKREVVEIISKGTITNTNLINEKDFNYIASVSDLLHIYVVSYADLLTGEIFTTYIEHNNNKLINYLLNLNILEVIVCGSFNKELCYLLKNNHNIFVSLFEDNESNNRYKNIFNSISDSNLIKNTNLLINYLELNQKKNLDNLQELKYVDNKQFLELDLNCVKNLELITTNKNNEKNYSLFWLLDRTKTAMGSRLLKKFLLRPSLNYEEITRRHNLVELFNKEFLFKSELKEYLYQIYDLERLTGKIVFGQANGRDLLQLKNSIKVLPDINNIFESLSLEKINSFNELYLLLVSSINEEAPITIKEGNIIKKGYNKELDELKEIKKNGKEFLLKFENEEKIRTGIKNLKIGFNKVFGYYIEISKKDSSLIKEEYGYIRKQTVSSGERYINSILKEKEDVILNAEDKIKNLEYDLFNEVKEKIKHYITDLQNVASILSYYDVMISLATVSEENNFVRPHIIKERSIKIISGKHPVVEKVIKDEYVENDIIMDNETDILLITGPNMSGKSTYMRELAIIIVLNQIGCFVPAKECYLPIFDKIFTRIGASDDLVGGESTFMVEMKESANALKNSTKDSLIIFDELGRGTSTFDGMSIATSIIEYIAEDIKCKTLFSTHYHEITNLSKTYSNIKNVYVSAVEEKDHIRFLHKVKPGSVSKSYGIGVAKLADLPDKVITNAKDILKLYENNNKHEEIEQIILNLEEEEKDELRDFIKKINPLTITPMEAINLLDEIKRKAE